VSWKDRKRIMPGLKAIYRAEMTAAAAAGLDRFEAEWGRRYPAIGQAWRRAWEFVVPLFAFPPAIRKMIYTADEIYDPFRHYLLSWTDTGDPAAKSRLKDCKPDRAAFSVVPNLRRLCAVSHCRAAAIGRRTARRLVRHSGQDRSRDRAAL
jgi:hypothetical protein